MNKNIQDMNKLVKMLQNQISKVKTETTQDYEKLVVGNTEKLENLENTNIELREELQKLSLRSIELEKQNVMLKNETQIMQKQNEKLEKEIKKVHDDARLSVLRIEDEIDKLIDKKLIVIQKMKKEMSENKKKETKERQVRQVTKNVEIAPAIETPKKASQDIRIKRKRATGNSTTILGLFNTEEEEF